MFYALFPNFNNTSTFSYLFRDDNLNDLYCFESVTASEMGSGVLTCEVIIIDSQTYVFEIFIEKIFTLKKTSNQKTSRGKSLYLS